MIIMNRRGIAGIGHNSYKMEVDSEGFIANSTLRHEEHVRYDTKLVEVARGRLNGIADLRSAGLTVAIGGVGVMLSMYEKVGDMTLPTINMDGVTLAQNDKIEFVEDGVPIPVYSSDWNINFRQLESSRTTGVPLPTTQMGIKTRLMADKIEMTLFNGIPELIVAGKTVYGYTTFPDRNCVSFDHDWSTDGATGEVIIKDITKMIEAANDDNRFGPFTMYVAQNVWLKLQQDYSTTKGINTIIERMLKFSHINVIKPTDFLKDGHVVMVMLQEDVVDLAIGQDLVNIEWTTDPGQTKFRIYSVMAPRIKSDFNGSCGIVHASPNKVFTPKDRG